jgi:hypothetical protein
MAFYVDPIMEHAPVCGFRLWAHLGTDDRSPAGIEALHAFAQRLGLKRRYYQNKPHHKHYDLVPSKRAMAIRLGAIPLSQRDYVRTCGDHPASLRAWLLEEEGADEQTCTPFDERDNDAGILE